MSLPLAYTFEEKEIRVIMIAGEPWFVANDLCSVLDIRNARDALSRLDDDEKGVGITDTPGGSQEMNIVSESGMWGLTFTSRKAEAKRFRKWVTSEVLPSIRKTGRYEMPGYEPPPMIPADYDPARMLAGVAVAREARRLFGPAAARSIWTQVGLPAPIVDAVPTISGDNLAEPLKAWLEDKTETTSLWAARGIGLEDIDAGTIMRISALLGLFGWRRHPSRRDGVKVNLWIAPSAEVLS